MDDAGDVVHAVADGAVHLRDAAEGVGVLHGLVVAVYNLAVLEDLAYDEGRLGLALVGAHLLDAGHEGVDAAVEGLHADGGEEVEALDHLPAVDEGLDAVGAHELCAVEQGEALLGLERDGLPAEDVEDVASGHSLAVVHDLAFADKRQEEVCQGCQVAGGAEGAAVVDDGVDVVVVEVEDALHGLDLHS